jgi:hypothetical protein
VILGVSNVEGVAIERHALWPVESCLLEWTIDSSAFSGADSFDERAIQFCNDDSIVI